MSGRFCEFCGLPAWFRITTAKVTQYVCVKHIDESIVANLNSSGEAAAVERL